MTPTGVLTAADLALRPATLDDAPFAADMWTAIRPSDPEDPVLTRYWWEHTWDDSVWERFVALRDGFPVGVCALSYPRSWEVMPERFARLQAGIHPDSASVERLAALLGSVEDRARAVGALRASTWVWENDDMKLAAAAARGFREERRERFWELDLRANAERLENMADGSRERMREQGIRVLTLDHDADAERYRKLWRMSLEAEQDVPTTVPHTPAPFDAFMATLRAPGIREDRTWIARRGDDVVGISMLDYPPVRGVVETAWTGTARSVRGMGVARALKCETVMQAIALGVDRVRTDNDSQNTPILHINESMGYRIHGEMIQLLKELGPH